MFCQKEVGNSQDISEQGPRFVITRCFLNVFFKKVTKIVNLMYFFLNILENSQNNYSQECFANTNSIKSYEISFLSSLVKTLTVQYNF